MTSAQPAETTPELRIVFDGRAYLLRQGDETLYGPATRELALEALERRQRAARRKNRTCLTCQSPFLSEGPHNRMCTPCRAQTAYDGSA